MNNSTNEKSWRLIYNDTDVLDLFESEGVTSTINNLFTSTNYEECLALINSLNLILDVNYDKNNS